MSNKVYQTKLYHVLLSRKLKLTLQISIDAKVSYMMYLDFCCYGQRRTPGFTVLHKTHNATYTSVIESATPSIFCLWWNIQYLMPLARQFDELSTCYWAIITSSNWTQLIAPRVTGRYPYAQYFATYLTVWMANSYKHFCNRFHFKLCICVGERHKCPTYFCHSK